MNTIKRYIWKYPVFTPKDKDIANLYCCEYGALMHYVAIVKDKEKRCYSLIDFYSENPQVFSRNGSEFASEYNFIYNRKEAEAKLYETVLHYEKRATVLSELLRLNPEIKFTLADFDYCKNFYNKIQSNIVYWRDLKQSGAEFGKANSPENSSQNLFEIPEIFRDEIFNRYWKFNSTEMIDEQNLTAICGLHDESEFFNHYIILYAANHGSFIARSFYISNDAGYKGDTENSYQSQWFSDPEIRVFDDKDAAFDYVIKLAHICEENAEIMRMKFGI